MDDTSAAAEPRRNRRIAGITIVVLQLLQILSLAPWAMMAGLSFMAFDAPGSEKLSGPWIFVIGICSYPLWIFAAAIASWILFAKRLHGWALGVAIFFTLPAVAIAALILLAANAGG